LLACCPQREASINNTNLIVHGKCEKSSGDEAPKLPHEKLHNVSKYGWLCAKRAWIHELSETSCRICTF
jgi:hypothetical protein